MSDYYKSLITDEEVIKELMKDSKRREGRLPTEVTRLKPNLNFFQRTVSNLVSNNTRIDKSQVTSKIEYSKDCNIEKPEKSNSASNSTEEKQKIDYAFEREIIMQKKINFVESTEPFSTSLVRNKKKIEIKKISFMGTAANTSNQIYGASNNSMKNSNKISSKQKTCDNSNNSHDNNVIVMSSDDDEAKTTCKVITKKSRISESKDLTKNNIICISSDEESGKVIDKKSGKRKKKIKKDKMRKKIKSPRESEEECKKKAKRKKHKRK